MAPHIAVPEAINIPKLLSTLNRFARNKPTKKIIITKTVQKKKFITKQLFQSATGTAMK